MSSRSPIMPSGRLVDERGLPTPAFRAYLASLERMRDLTERLGTAEEDIAAAVMHAQTHGLSGAVQFADDGDYSFYWDADACEVNETKTDCDSGTATATFKKNGVAFPGTANAVSTTEQAQVHSPAVTLVRGDLITISISSSASCAGMRFLISGTRTLA